MLLLSQWLGLQYLDFTVVRLRFTPSSHIYDLFMYIFIYHIHIQITIFPTYNRFIVRLSHPTSRSTSHKGGKVRMIPMAPE